MASIVLQSYRRGFLEEIPIRGLRNYEIDDVRRLAEVDVLDRYATTGRPLSLARRKQKQQRRRRRRDEEQTDDAD